MDLFTGYSLSPYEKSILKGLKKTRLNLENHIEDIKSGRIKEFSSWNFHHSVPRYISNVLENLRKILNEDKKALIIIKKLKEGGALNLYSITGPKLIEQEGIELKEGLQKLIILQEVFYVDYKKNISIVQRIMPVYSTKDWVLSFNSLINNNEEKIEGKIFFHDYKESQLHEIPLEDYFLTHLSHDQIIHKFKVVFYLGINNKKEVLLDGERVIRLPYFDLDGKSSDRFLVKPDFTGHYFQSKDIDQEVLGTFLPRENSYYERFYKTKTILDLIIKSIESGFLEEVKRVIQSWKNELTFNRYQDRDYFAEIISGLTEIENFQISAIKLVKTTDFHKEQQAEMVSTPSFVRKIDQIEVDGVSSVVEENKPDNIAKVEEKILLPKLKIEAINFQDKPNEPTQQVQKSEKGWFEKFFFNLIKVIVFCFAAYIVISLATGVLIAIDSLIATIFPIIVVAAIILFLMGKL